MNFLEYIILQFQSILLLDLMFSTFVHMFYSFIKFLEIFYKIFINSIKNKK
jgi:hypothetical protein